MPYHKIEPEEINVFPLKMRKSKSLIQAVAIDPDSPPPAAPEIAGAVRETAERIRLARENHASVVLAFGAHLIKNGLAPVVIKLMEDGWVTHVATNGAGGIHDWEFAWLGRSEEDVRENVAEGQFGTWEETGKYINLAVLLGALHDMGYGESVGALIAEEKLVFPDPAALADEIKASLAADTTFTSARAELLHTMRKFNLSPGIWRLEHPYSRYSILAQAYRLQVPATIHPGIGYDIIYNNPFANGAALGRGAHTDFKIMVKAVSNLSYGVFLSIGSAIMAPQVFEKAISFANNLKIQADERIIHDHFMVVNDLQPASWDWRTGEPPKESPDYYFRFLKSFYRMGGEVRYVSADNRAFLLNLYHALKARE